jgi:hypothetical protein
MKMDTDIDESASFTSVMYSLDGELGELRRTARTLAAVGLDKPADEIGFAIANIAQIRAWVTNHVNGELDKSLAHSRHMVGAIMSGIVNGNIGPKKEPPK